MARSTSDSVRVWRSGIAIVMLMVATAAWPGAAAEPAANGHEILPQPRPAGAAVVNAPVLVDKPETRTIATSLFEDLLSPPTAASPPGPLVSEDLRAVPEAQLWAPREGPRSFVAATDQMRNAFQEVRKFNSNHSDGFIEALRGHRADLADLPFALGNACRTSVERSRRFKEAATVTRTALLRSAASPPDLRASHFWQIYAVECFVQQGALAKLDSADRDQVINTRAAALVQMLGPESAELRRGLVRHLADASDAGATRALAQLAVFSMEDAVRLAAIEALKGRSAPDSAEVLRHGLRYPWPAVVQRAADAVARLERTDLAPQLVSMLEAPDPRAPTLRDINGKPTPVVRELVRLNHQRSCLLCHAPADRETPKEVLTAQAPVIDVAPPSRNEYYRQVDPILIVRTDVTYLRQDFSVMLPVPNDRSEVKMWRFDFVVRERALTEKEADQYRRILERHELGKLSPHRVAALEALRKLTGKDAGPSALDWRDLLKLQAAAR